MNKEEALQILALQDNESEVDIRKKYNELYNEYQIRLTNAPTPNLKKLYQKNLQELNEALNFLLHGQTSGVLKELPSSTPVFATESEYKPPVTSQQSHNIATGPVKKTVQKPAEKKTPKGVYIFGILSVIAISSALLLFIFLNEKKALVEELNSTLAAEKIKSDSLNHDLLEYTSNFKNGKLKITNKGSKNMQLTWLIVSYTGEDGKLKKVEKWMDITIEPNKSEQEKFQEIKGDDVTWDGSVVSYAFGIIYGGQEWSQAGVWTHDAKDGALAINLDK